MAATSFIEAAYQILKREDKPLSAEEAENLIHTSGKTPSATMSAVIYVDIESKGGSSRFVKVDRGKFFLREAEKPKETPRETGKPSVSLHDEIKQMLYEIGSWREEFQRRSIPLTVNVLMLPGRELKEAIPMQFL